MIPKPKSLFRFDPPVVPDAMGGGGLRLLAGGIGSSAGKFGQALAAAGSAELLGYGRFDGGADSFAFSAWLKCDVLGSAVSVFLRDQSGSDIGGAQASFGSGGTATLRLNATDETVADIPMPAGWVHVAVSCVNGTPSFWVNGSPVAISPATVPAYAYGYELSVLLSGGAAVDDLAVVHGPLSAAAVAALWNGGAGVPCPGE